MNRLVARLAIAIPLLLLTACSQIDALTPVGGAAITTVRNATYEVLIDQGIPILVAPQCETTASGFLCSGSTVENVPITAEAGSTAPFTLVISVGSNIIFDGTAQAVIDAAVLESS